MGNQSNAVELILASASPRRQSLLREAGYEFKVHPADLDEEAITTQQKWTAQNLAAELARLKAEKVAENFPDSLVLGADTVVSLGQEILGKPNDAQHARRILASLSGTTHQVITGVALVRRTDHVSISRIIISTVEMKPLQPHEIDAYIASGDWQGKAGAYGIQDRDPFVRRTAGCYTNIMGLPMTTTAEMLKSAGVHAQPRIR
jgi:septum formation protein